MKNAFVLVLAVFVAFIAVPAFAGDGQVPQATLRALGLGDIQVASDAEGMQVRGMASSAAASSMSLYSIILIDPLTNNVFVFAAAQHGSGSEQEAGVGLTSTATAGTATGTLNTSINININGGGYTAVIQAFSIVGTASATGG